MWQATSKGVKDGTYKRTTGSRASGGANPRQVVSVTQNQAPLRGSVWHLSQGAAGDQSQALPAAFRSRRGLGLLQVR